MYAVWLESDQWQTRLAVSPPTVPSHQAVPHSRFNMPTVVDVNTDHPWVGVAGPVVAVAYNSYENFLVSSSPDGGRTFPADRYRVLVNDPLTSPDPEPMYWYPNDFTTATIPNSDAINMLFVASGSSLSAPVNYSFVGISVVASNSRCVELFIRCSIVGIGLVCCLSFCPL